MRLRTELRVCAAACVAAGLAQLAAAQATMWINPAGGLWDDPANWSNGVPGANTEVILQATSPAPITLGGMSRSCGEVMLPVGLCTLDLAAARLSLGVGALEVGAAGMGAELRVEGPGNLAAYPLDGAAIRVGAAAGSNAVLRLDAAGCSARSVLLGGQGVGSLVVGEGARLALEAYQGGVVIAPGSSLIVRGGEFRGEAVCAGLIRIEAGGRYLMSPGVQLEPTGTLVVSGFGSSVDYVPVNGEGTLRVEDSTHATFLGVCVRRLELERASVVLAGGVCGAEFIMSDAGVSWNGGMGAVSGPMFVLEAGSRVALAYSIEVEELRVTEGSRVETWLLRSPNASASGIGTEMVVSSCSANLCVESGAVLSGGAPESEVIDLGIGGSMRWHGPRVLRICDGGSFVSRSAQVFSGAVVLETGSETEAGTVHLGGAPLHWLAEVAISEATPYSSLTKNAGAVLTASDLRVLRGASIGLFTAAGTMSGGITLDGILRPSGFLLDGGIIASSTGFTEISLDASVPAIAATGACNLAAGLTVITREGPVAAGESWTVVEAGSFALGAIALPSLGPGLEWALNTSATSLSLAATAVQIRCRPSVDRLSAAVVDGYVGDPIVLAAAVSGPVSDVRWYKDGLPLADGGIYSGAETPELSIASNAPVNLARYHLIATGLCGKTASLPIDASVRCGGDFNQDFSVDGDDIIDFFGLWDSGEIAADWNHDGSVDGDDVIGFFAKWDAGC